ncbi:hypothetical protein, partial [Yersinia hibernica]|uniref:hypothetical protein n=1 Tax=Yersinia hibernica TaxID=2339259 RepID=UPI001C94FA69
GQTTSIFAINHPKGKEYTNTKFASRPYFELAGIGKSLHIKFDHYPVVTSIEAFFGRAPPHRVLYFFLRKKMGY